MSSAALSHLVVASAESSRACLSSAIMSARTAVEPSVLASTVVSFEFLLDFLKFKFDQNFHPVPLAGLLAA